MGRDPIKNLQWNKGGRPPTSNKIGAPDNRTGGDGDVQIRQTALGARLFGKIGGRWYNTPLTLDDKVRFGTAQADQLIISNDAVSIFKDNLKVASFGATTTIGDTSTEHIKLTSSSMDMLDGSTTMMSLAAGNISMTGKITITSTGSQNVMMGKWDATDPDVDGVEDNVVLGIEAGKLMEDGAEDNVCIGTTAGDAITTGKRHVAIGMNALSEMSSGLNCVAIGSGALRDATGDYNIGIGYGAVSDVNTGTNNIGIGSGTIQNIADVIGAIAIGKDAGGDTASTGWMGNYSICIGEGANVGTNSDTNSIVIGRDAVGKGSNTVVLGSADVTQVWAAYDAGATIMCGGIGVGTDSPSNLLEVSSGSDAYIEITADDDGAGTSSAGIILSELTTAYWTIRNNGNSTPINDFEIINGSNAGVHVSQGETSWDTASDIALKEDINPIANSLAKINEIRGVKFKWKKYAPGSANPNPENITEDEWDVMKVERYKYAVGVIAQEVNEVLPEAVSAYKEGEWSVRYTEIIPLLIEAVKELSAKVDTMQTEINNLS